MIDDFGIDRIIRSLKTSIHHLNIGSNCVLGPWKSFGSMATDGALWAHMAGTMTV
jgi:hypothetical protein